MALLTKAEVRTAIRQAIDDPSAKRWGDTALDSLISMVQDTIWQQLLDTWPWLLSQSDTLTPSNGAVAISDLTKRLYRIQRVVVNGLELQPKLYTEALPQATYYLLGGSIVTDPAASGDVEVTYAYLPTKFSDLAQDSTQLDSWPEGHEMALVYTSAAVALAKGDAESIAQTALLANFALEAMVTHISRLYPIAAAGTAPAVKLGVVLTQLGERQ